MANTVNSNMKKLKAAISDTDILIHLLKADCLNILNLLFEEIIIPQYIFSVELKKIAGIHYYDVVELINSKDSIFKVVDRSCDFAFNKLALPVIEEYRMFLGKGESECAGYATATGIPIIISNNTNEFKYLEQEFIMLNYYIILTLCSDLEIITPQDALSIYNKVY